LTLISKSEGNKFAGNLHHLLSLSASCALAAAIGLHSFAAPPAQAITTEQLLFLEAWRAVDRAYVDKTFNNQSWFKVKIIMSLQACCCKFLCLKSIIIVITASRAVSQE